MLNHLRTSILNFASTTGLLFLCLLSTAQQDKRNPYHLPLTISISEYKQQVTEDGRMELVDLQQVLKNIVPDIRYATKNNFTKEIIYTLPRAYVRKPVADALQKVQDSLAIYRLGLKIFDAYRPYSATLRFYEVYPDTSFVADPMRGSRHNRGCAVDISLVNLDTKKEIPMPTGFDDFSEKAFPSYTQLPEEVIANRKFLFGVMEHFGFVPITTEWWHFDFKGWKSYPLMDIPFDDLENENLSGDVISSAVTHSNRITQFSTFDALLQGAYQGVVTMKELGEKGDFGIGTFDSLDGEMVLSNGVVYQVKGDGKVYQPVSTLKTPFATVCQFHAESKRDVSGLTFDQLKAVVDSLLPSRNYFYAIHMKGKFKSVHTRSVPAQQRPYPALVNVTKNQPEFFGKEQSGEIIGFFCPEFTKSINVPGYHCHFLSDDKSFGGHLLGFELDKGILELEKLTTFEMHLPESNEFKSSTYQKDRSAETRMVEGGGK